MNTSLEIIRSAGTDYLCYRMEDDTFVAVHNPMLSFTEKEDEFEIIPTDKSYREKLYIYQGRLYGWFRRSIATAGSPSVWNWPIRKSLTRL